MTGSNWWRPEWKNASYNASYEERELKRKLYLAVSNVNILEGIRFYVSFACSFGIWRTQTHGRSAKIISLIARDENQYTVLHSTNDQGMAEAGDELCHE